MPVPPPVRAALSHLKRIREAKNISATELEQRLILGPGWIDRFESGEFSPTVDVLFAVLQALGAPLSALAGDIDEPASGSGIDRFIFAEEVPKSRDLLVRFRYADHDAAYRLQSATLAEFDAVLLEMRNGLARLVAADEKRGQAIKVASVARAFLRAVSTWKHANPSDLWWFIIQRAYCDPFNHPARFARLSFEQSWKRTGGWALEEIFVRHYGAHLLKRGVRMFIASTEDKQRFLRQLKVADRLESDKVDVLLTGDPGPNERCFGVVHVKASFAERRTDDVPMSHALVRAGYCSPLLTMDCKSGPSATPVNHGELGEVLRPGSVDGRSAKRKDIEDDGYFSGCFSYNKNTRPTPPGQKAKSRIHVCDFSDPDDAFSRFILAEWQRVRSSR